MKFKSLAALALLAFVLPVRALAWDDTGHRQVADIAWTKLTSKTKKQIAAILNAGDPKFRPVGSGDAAVREAFRNAATFPDAIKFTENTSYEDIIEPMNRLFFVTTMPDPNDKEDSRCKTWHYYDLPIRDTGHHAAKESNAVKAMAKAEDGLAASADDRKMQCWWLYWIEHVTGDLHQPLHCCSNYETLENGDQGGNLFMIKLPGTNRSGRLHGYWDAAIGKAIGAERERGLSPKVEDVSKRWIQQSPPAHGAAANLDVMSWVKDGAVLADTQVYAGIQQDQAPSPQYDDQQMALCKRQAVLAGLRLAAILNSELGK